MSSTAAAQPRDRSQEATRCCLKCRGSFLSSGPHNRICPRCAPQVNALASGVVSVATLGTASGRAKSGDAP